MNSNSTSPAVPSAGLPLPRIGPLDDTYGAMLLGSFVSLILYGVELHQAYRYARVGFSDSKLMKLYVAFLVAMDTYYSTLCMHLNYWYLITNYFRPSHLFTGIWSLNCMIIMPCQCFFARRAYLIGGPRLRPILAFVGLMFMLELGFTAAVTSEAFILPDLNAFRKIAWLSAVCFGVGVVSDVLITSILIWVLRRSRTGFKRTDTIIDVLITYSIGTGLITDVFSIIILVLVLVGPDQYIYVGFDMVTTKLYVNCVLAALNARESILPRIEHAHRPGLIDLALLPRSDASTTVPSEPWNATMNRSIEKHPGVTESTQAEISLGKVAEP
ncbi:hypothetical protein OH77DRAFT_1522258 [Trametes cingulata]|nr:hypothetical protein OH77DRAFT_1522258 [Trametes cingulata]